MSEEIRVCVKCPACGRRIFDKTSTTSGTIEIKCPHCRKVVPVNLSLRRRPRYRRIRRYRITEFTTRK